MYVCKSTSRRGKKLQPLICCYWSMCFGSTFCWKPLFAQNQGKKKREKTKQNKNKQERTNERTIQSLKSHKCIIQVYIDYNYTIIAYICMHNNVRIHNYGCELWAELLILKKIKRKKRIFSFAFHFNRYRYYSLRAWLEMRFKIARGDHTMEEKERQIERKKKTFNWLAWFLPSIPYNFPIKM